MLGEGKEEMEENTFRAAFPICDEYIRLFSHYMSFLTISVRKRTMKISCYK